MKIFFKYVLRTMLEKKARLVLFLFAFTLSTALFFASIGLTDLIVDSVSRPIVEKTEGNHMRIVPEAGDAFFDMDGIRLAGIESYTGTIVLSGVVQNMDYQTAAIQGRKYDSLSAFTFANSPGADDFNGPKAIVSSRTAGLFSLETGDRIDVLFAGQTHSLEIVGIASNEGLFYGDTNRNFEVVIPYDYVGETLGVEGLYNHVSAVKSDDTLAASIALFNEMNDDFRAVELYNADLVASMANQQVNALMLMLVFIVLVSGIIVYGAFKLIATERRRVIGTFLSQGATKGTIRRILMAEGFVYGLLGAILGVLLGVGILYALNDYSSPLRAYGVVEPFRFDPMLIVYAALFSIGFAMVSALVPVWRSARREVKDIILDIREPDKKKGNLTFVIGILLLSGSALLSYALPTVAIDVAPLLMLLAIVGVLMVYPHVLNVLVLLFFRRILPIFRLTALSVQNVRTSTALRGNISVIIIAAISVVTVVSLSTSLVRTVTDAFDSMRFDIYVSDIQTNDPESRETIMSALRGDHRIVTESIMETTYVEGNVNGEFAVAEGIDPALFDDFTAYINFADDEGSMLDALKDPAARNTVIASTTANRLNLDVGSAVELDINGIVRTYNVTGIVDVRLWNSRDMFFINLANLREDHHIDHGRIYFDTYEDPEGFAGELQDFFRGYGGVVQTRDEARDINIENNRQFSRLLSAFSLFAIVIGSFGALNNMFISYLQRKRDFAVLESLGTQRGQRNRILLAESLFCVVFALLVVVLYGSFHARLVGQVSSFILLPMDIRFSLVVMLPFLLASIAIYALATLPLLIKTKELDVIEEMKME